MCTRYTDVRRGGDQVQVELALQPLRDDLHVQQAEEAAAEAEAQRDRGLRLVGQRGVVELQLVQRVAQLRIVRPSTGYSPEYTIGLRLAVAGERLGRRRRAQR